MTRPLNRELGRINAQDREYAASCIEDMIELGAVIGDLDGQREVVAAWFRKNRYEAVMADRAKRLTGGHGETAA